VVGVQIGAADSGAVYPQKDVGWFLDRGLRDVLDPHVPRPEEGKRFHRQRFYPRAAFIVGRVAASLFDLDGISLSRGGKQVLKGVSAQLPEGASAVVGPSGCGKSTLLRLLNRLADPDAGSISYRSRALSSYEVLGLRREVCLVPQLPALLEGTVAGNVSFAARLAGREPDTDRLLELAGLDSSFADRDAARLSVGEQQRVMLARTLALEPSVLLLDEPTSALDEAARDSVEATLLDLRARLGLSFVLVTHDLAQANRMADSFLSLDNGCVVDER
jgi:putative ABC transport system ATP-binding protein